MVRINTYFFTNYIINKTIMFYIYQPKPFYQIAVEEVENYFFPSRSLVGKKIFFLFSTLYQSKN